MLRMNFPKPRSILSRRASAKQWTTLWEAFDLSEAIHSQRRL
ncbi:hypothetical protein LINPERHAP2_LOCUS38212 [Linum perenne]